MLGLANRDYLSIKIDTDQAIEPLDKPYALNYSFGIKAGFHKQNFFNSQIKKVIIRITFNLCDKKTISAVTTESVYPLNWNKGTQDLMTEA